MGADASIQTCDLSMLSECICHTNILTFFKMVRIIKDSDLNLTTKSPQGKIQEYKKIQEKTKSGITIQRVIC